MEELKNLLWTDLLEKKAIIKNELQTSYIILNYLKSLNLAEGLFDNSYNIISAINEEISEIVFNEIDQAEKAREDEIIWKFINIRAKILYRFTRYIDNIGVIQKSIAQRLDSLPNLYPSPPMLRICKIITWPFMTDMLL